jgi:hypothetical protein
MVVTGGVFIMAERRVVFRGRTVNTRTKAMLERAEKRLGYELTIVQGSYNQGVSASAGTHDGGGVVDLAPYDYKRKVLVLRQVGFAAWHRPALAGVWPEHIHAVAIGDKELAWLAAQQVTQYKLRQNGLANHGPDNGPRLDPIPVWPIAYPFISPTRIKYQFTISASKRKSIGGVKAVQKCLNWRLGGDDLVVDGVVGPKTKEAYKRWQKKIGNTPDGVPKRNEIYQLVVGFFRLYPA